MEPTPATTALRALQRLVQERGGRVCFLQSRQLPGASAESDVDMAIDRRGRELLPEVFSALRDEQGYRLVQAIQWDVPFAYYFVLAPPEPSAAWLRPDICWDPWESSANFIGTDQLLDHTVLRDGFVHLQPDVEWAYQVFKRLRKGGASEAQLAHAKALQEGVDSLSLGHHLLERRLPRPLVYELRGAIEDGDGTRLRQLSWLARPWLQLPRELRGPARQAQLQAQRAQSRLAHPAGLVVWLHGPDPVVTRACAQTLATQLAPVFRGRHRIVPVRAAGDWPATWRWRTRLARAELDIRIVHPGAPSPPSLPEGWALSASTDECPRDKVLLHLHSRMTNQGWYAAPAADRP